MGNHAENTFYSHLCQPDSLDIIVREGFTLEVAREVLPTEVGRKVTAWAIDQYFKSGRIVAPSKEAIMKTWGDQLVPLEIEIDDETELESIHWCIETLKTDYADFKAGEFATAMVKAVRNADGPDRVDEVLKYSELLHQLSQSLISRTDEMKLEEGFEDAILRYEDIAKNGNKLDGIVLGLGAVDEYLRGIHPGELAVFAGTSGGGKSWAAGNSLIENFRLEKKCILYTLENSVEMTFDRLACIAAKVDYEKWQHGACDDTEVYRVRMFRTQLMESPVKPIVVQPDTGEMTAAAMVRRAVVEQADGLIIDQLTFIEPRPDSKKIKRNEEVGEIVKDLHKLINGREKISCILLHQINREGRVAAQKTGHFDMSHMGEATWVENTADIILAIYQSPDHIATETAELQMLKSRRTKIKDFEMVWRPSCGDLRVRKEITR